MNDIHPFRQLLKHPNFSKLWTSQLLSQLTINLVNFSILSHIYSSTGSSVAVSLLWLAYSLPALLFGPFAGSLVDNFSLRRMMIITNLLQAVTIASYLLVGNHIFLLYSLVFVYSTLDQLYIPAQQASVPWVVPPHLLTVANGIFLLTQQASFLVGFGLGGIFLSLISRQATIIVSTLFLLIASLAVFLLPSDKKRSRQNLTFDRFFTDLKAGYVFVRVHPAIKFPLILIVSLQVLITLLSIVLPSYTYSVLGLNLNQAGPLLLVPGSLSALAFTYALPRLLKYRRKKNIIETGLFIAAISIGLLSQLGHFSQLRIFLAVLVATGLGMSLASVIAPANTLLQEHTPMEMRGRIYGSLGFLMTVSTILPLLIMSSFADIFGVGAMIFIISLLIFGGSLFIHFAGDSLLQGKLDFS